MGPSVIVMKSGEFVFGAYITTQWRHDGVRFGNPKCFMFSSTLDLKFPYHGRQKDGKSQLYGMRNTVQHDCMMCTPQIMQLGLNDLCIQEDLAT